MDESHTIDVRQVLHLATTCLTPPKGNNMLETLAQQIKEFGKKISTNKFKAVPLTSEIYIMDESTKAYILYDSMDNIKEIKFYRFEA